MKIKILVAPLLIVGIIVLLIWFIYPLWTNGSDGIKEKQSEYETQKTRQAELEKKKGGISDRYKDIEDNKSKVDLLYRFLPETMAEEEIIDKLQYLTIMKQEDLDRGWLEGPGKIALTMCKDLPIIASSETPLDSGQGNATVLIKKNLYNFDLEFAFFGPYERVREVIKSIYSLKRYNKVSKFKATAGLIKREGNLLKWEDTKGEPANGLKVEMTMTYNYFNVGQVGSENINDPVFSLERLGEIKWAAIDAISSKETDIVPLILPQTGRENPFLLP